MILLIFRFQRNATLQVRCTQIECVSFFCVRALQSTSEIHSSISKSLAATTLPGIISHNPCLHRTTHDTMAKFVNLRRQRQTSSLRVQVRPTPIHQRQQPTQGAAPAQRSAPANCVWSHPNRTEGTLHPSMAREPAPRRRVSWHRDSARWRKVYSVYETLKKCWHNIRNVEEFLRQYKRGESPCAQKNKQTRKYCACLRGCMNVLACATQTNQSYQCKAQTKTIQSFQLAENPQDAYTHDTIISVQSTHKIPPFQRAGNSKNFQRPQATESSSSSDMSMLTSQ